MDILDRRISCRYRWNGWRFADCMVIREGKSQYHLLHNDKAMAGSRNRSMRGFLYSRNMGSFPSVEK